MLYCGDNPSLGKGFAMVRIILFLVLAATSGPASVGFAQTPHALLGDGSPEAAQKALEIMKLDPTWVARPDSHGMLPLHVAAQLGHKPVVEWLLEQGANVDAKADNGFTPLHLTESPEIVRLILGKAPNLKLESTSGTPLQNAIELQRHCSKLSARMPDQKQKANDLKAIVEMYVEHVRGDIDLISAVRLGQIETVKKLVHQNPAAARGNTSDPNPLREAADWGQLEICRFLVEQHNFDVNDFEGGSGYPIINSALRYPNIVNYLIQQGADLKTRITWSGGRSGIWLIGDDATVLHFAASDGVPETIRILLDAGVDPFALAHDGFDTEDKQAALEVAAYFGKTDNAIAILEHPKFKGSADPVRQQILDESLIAGSYSSGLDFEAQDRSKLLEALITHGANAKATEDNRSLIQVAVIGIHPDDEVENENIRKMVSVLRKHGAELDVFSAVAIADLDALAELLEDDPKASKFRSSDGYPALHKAIQMNYPKAVKLLLDSGCDIEIKNESESIGSRGDTPLLCAAFWGHEEITRLFIRAGANVNATAERGVTPLHEAVRMGHAGIAKLLLEKGANKQAKDQDGQTPLDWVSDPALAKEFTELFSRYGESPTKK